MPELFKYIVSDSAASIYLFLHNISDNCSDAGIPKYLYIFLCLPFTLNAEVIMLKGRLPFVITRGDCN